GRPMRLPRMTTRRWMLVIALIAVAIYAEQTRRRWAYFRDQAAHHAEFEWGSQAYADDARGVPGGEQRVERGETLAAYHARMRQKYEHAARYSWLPVEP